MCTNFGSAGIPGTRLKVCGWWVVVGGGGGGGSHTHYRITPVQDLELELKTGTARLQLQF